MAVDEPRALLANDNLIGGPQDCCDLVDRRLRLIDLSTGHTEVLQTKRNWLLARRVEEETTTHLYDFEALSNTGRGVLVTDFIEEPCSKAELIV